MADRRPEDAAPTAPMSPVPDESDRADRPARADAPGRPDPSYDEQQELSERINAAYASSQPVVPDESTPPRPSGASPAGAKAGSEKGSEKGSETRAGADAGGERRRPTGAERFAAVLASTGGSASRPQKAPNAGQPKTASVKRVRRARLRLTHIDPWSVMKTSFLLSVAIGIVTVVAVAVVWSVIGAAGVWESIDSAIGDVLGENSEGFRVEDYVGMSRVMGFTMIVAVVDVVLITVIATLAAFLYNLAAALLGGIEVVLAEDDR
jgi:hypothetical protein